jgi:eukaryotic-like serine/threonine-protein kinase
MKPSQGEAFGAGETINGLGSGLDGTIDGSFDGGLNGTLDGGFGATMALDQGGFGATLVGDGAGFAGAGAVTIGLPQQALGVPRGVTEGGMGRGIGRPSGVTKGLDGRATISGFSTMLPRVEGLHLVNDPQPRFEILKSLGQGGMGEVNLVKDHEIGRTVAVKRLLGDGADLSGVARFVDEVRTTGYLEHPNIVPIYDAGVDDQGKCFFIMKHLAGETLESVINKLQAGDPAYHARFPFHVRAQIMLGLLNALQFAHAQKVIHRDIKPANVMVGPYGEVVLMDWGVAKPVKDKGQQAQAPQKTGQALGDAPEDQEVMTQSSAIHQRLFETRHGALVGTPAYMSPEQAQGFVDDTDERSDLYSVGVMFLEMLTLKHYLHNKRSVMEMLTGILTVMPKAHNLDTRADVQDNPPAELVYVALRAMEKAPAERYGSAAEMIDALQKAISGQINIQCGVTFTKRGLTEVSRLLEQHPIVLLPMHLMYAMMPKAFMTRHPKAIAPLMLCMIVLPISLVALSLGLALHSLIA